jgi:hypothetical protein
MDRTYVEMMANHYLKSTGKRSAIDRVYTILLLHANKNGNTWPSVHTISIECNIHVRHVKRALQQLIDLGEIVDISEPGGHKCWKIAVFVDLKSPVEFAASIEVGTTLSVDAEVAVRNTESTQLPSEDVIRYVTGLDTLGDEDVDSNDVVGFGTPNPNGWDERDDNREVEDLSVDSDSLDDVAPYPTLELPKPAETYTYQPYSPSRGGFIPTPPEDEIRAVQAVGIFRELGRSKIVRLIQLWYRDCNKTVSSNMTDFEAWAVGVLKT